MTLRHVVMWKLASTDAAERSAQAAELVRRLHALEGFVPQIRAITASANTLYPEANWDATLTVDFDSVEALEEYRVHPDHQEVVAYVASVVSERAVVDFEV
ncbi:Dabb family protein [Microbacterium sp. NIBRBAC000506063]|uniref:Dabb family protein n=1 Tax=Microbacterium sp. NIBRBAC000506063 TaxID=2734618 RepID=UPI001BB5D8E8|nr:Dabb family protein [Microbacterium sp. NIBRBAC000506063]QTV80110.1 Dabb family protein [Microbacterium sp. NIBRBAC000506063]